MKSRLGNLKSNLLITTLKGLQLDVDELKNRQFVSGQSGVLDYLSQTANTWDLTQTIGTAGVQNAAAFAVTFTSDGTQPYPILNPFALLKISSSISVTPTQVSPQAPYWNDGTNNVQLDNFLSVDKTTLGNSSVTTWTLSFSYTGVVTYYLKAYAIGTSRGTVTVVRTS